MDENKLIEQAYLETQVEQAKEITQLKNQLNFFKLKTAALEDLIKEVQAKESGEEVPDE